MELGLNHTARKVFAAVVHEMDRGFVALTYEQISADAKERKRKDDLEARRRARGSK